ncbi:MAG: carboxy terminal-processing peptidase, partial [Thermoguttaceae bacterium]|nr:carboxy terminal-processing peptidase [Thermoguttaceae bacterium]
ILSLEADKRDEEKKEKNKEQDDTAPSNAEAVSNPWADETPIERLHRRYSSFQKRMHHTSNDDVLEIALTAIANVYDPHTSYLSPKSYENFNIQMSLNFEGIGATLGWEDGYTQVKEIVKGSPAQKQGELAVGDRIIGVGQGESGPIEDVVDMKLSDVVDKIRGKGGTVVRLQVIPGNRIIKIVRDRIDLDDSAAKGEIFQAGQRPDGTPYKIGVIDLPSFYLDTDALRRGETEAHGTVHDVQVILDQFVREKVDACVVDLRLNGGGILPEAISLTGLFVEGGTVVQVKPDPHRRGDKDSVIFHNDPDPGISWGGPLVVLTSRFSASASEIFAGAIKDYHRGLVVGDKTTHGKGSVQSVTPIADLLFGSMLEEAPNLGMIKVTVQGFWLPGGDTSQIRGIPSDVVIPSLTGHLEGIGESDLDNPLKLEKIQPAKYLPTFNYVTPEIVEALAKLSEDRTAKSPDFIKVEEKISLYDQYKSKKTTSLNREKYFAELEKLDSDKEEEEKIEKVIRNSSEITRDYYLDEVLNITSDYLNILASKNIVFEKEKSGSVLNFLGR